MEEVAKTHYAKRVKAGIGYLDGVEPGWLDKINLGTLNMGNGVFCLLGQLYGDYAYWRALNPDADAFRFFYGFELTDADILTGMDAGFRNGSYGLLTAAWREAIEAKRGQREADSGVAA